MGKQHDIDTQPTAAQSGQTQAPSHADTTSPEKEAAQSGQTQAPNNDEPSSTQSAAAQLPQAQASSNSDLSPTTPTTNERDITQSPSSPTASTSRESWFEWWELGVELQASDYADIFERIIDSERYSMPSKAPPNYYDVAAIDDPTERFAEDMGNVFVDFEKLRNAPDRETKYIYFELLTVDVERLVELINDMRFFLMNIGDDSEKRSMAARGVKELKGVLNKLMEWLLEWCH